MAEADTDSHIDSDDDPGADTGRGRRASRPTDSDSDEQLVASFQTGRGQGAVTELLRRHEGLVRSVARRYFVPGGDGDDVRQQAMIGFWKAVRDYSPTGGSSFVTFARTCMQRQVVTAVRAATRHKHAPLTGSDRIDNTDADTDSHEGTRRRSARLPTVGHEDSAVERLTIDDAGGMPFGLTEIERLLEAVGHEAVHALVRDHFADRPSRRRADDGPAQLSENEAHVLIGLLAGKSYAEIAADLDKTSKFVDNTIQRLRGKLRHLL